MEGFFNTLRRRIPRDTVVSHPDEFFASSDTIFSLKFRFQIKGHGF